jgi:hypothetical protein
VVLVRIGKAYYISLILPDPSHYGEIRSRGWISYEADRNGDDKEALPLLHMFIVAISSPYPFIVIIITLFLSRRVWEDNIKNIS